MTEQQHNPNERPRGSNGRFAEHPHTAERDGQAAGLRADGRTFQQIADALGYADKGEAWRAVQRAKTAILKEPVERLIQTEAERLDELYAEALEVLARDHVTVSHGRIVCDDTGAPILDDGPKLAALDRLVKIRESYRKLHGLDAPSKVSVDATHLGAEIGDMLAQLAGDTDGHPDDHA